MMRGRRRIKYGWSPTFFCTRLGRCLSCDGREREVGYQPPKKRRSHTKKTTLRNTPPWVRNLASLRNCPSLGLSGCKRHSHHHFSPLHADASVWELSIDFVLVMIWSFSKKGWAEIKLSSCSPSFQCGEWPVPVAPLTASPSSPHAEQTLPWLHVLEQRGDDLEVSQERTYTHKHRAASTAISPPPEACQLNRPTDPLSPVPAPSLPHSFSNLPAPPNSGVCFSPLLFPPWDSGTGQHGPPAPPTQPWGWTRHRVIRIPRSIRFQGGWHFLVPQLYNPTLVCLLVRDVRDPSQGHPIWLMEAQKSEPKALKSESRPWRRTRRPCPSELEAFLGKNQTPLI